MAAQWVHNSYTGALQVCPFNVSTFPHNSASFGVSAHFHLNSPKPAVSYVQLP